MNIKSKKKMLDNTKVNAYDFDTREFVGTFDSMSVAARKLFIKHRQCINSYLNGSKKRTYKKAQRGVKSNKTGKLFHFEKVIL